MLGGTALAGCDRFPQTAVGRHALQAGEDANLFVQRLLLSDAKLAPEYAETDISPWFKPNGTSDPPDRAYKALARRKFAEFQLVVDGLVEHPLKISLADLRTLPSRTQITRHDCVEGWSCIGKWTGVPMRELLQRAALKPNARYVVLHCADTMEGGDAGSDDDVDEGAKLRQGERGHQQPQRWSSARPARTRPPTTPRRTGPMTAGPARRVSTGTRCRAPVRYYETIDLTDAFHPQTILAYDMNGAALPVEHGAPLRMRLERQLGYKMAKYVMRLEVVDTFAGLGLGRGGYWEDRGYDWYAGI